MMFRKKDNRRKQHKDRSGKQKLMVLAGWLLCMAFFGAGGFIVLDTSGKYNLKNQTAGYVAQQGNAVQAVPVMAGKQAVLQDGSVSHKGQGYSYNEDILTFLAMGISEENRADALFLLVLDSHEKSMRLIPIDCNTMTEVDVYDRQGNRTGVMTAQIGTQYGYGDGGRASCEYQVKAVQNLLGGIPVNGYLAVDMNAVPEVAALTEGTDLEIPEDLSTESRLARQTYLLTEFISRGKQLAREDFTVPVRIYNELSGQAVTDITVDEVAYLATVAGTYQFDAGQVITIPGRGINGNEDTDSGYDEFYVDEEALYRLVLDVFYETGD